MQLFETEEYFSRYEFSRPYQLASSDCESVTVAELIQIGGGSVEEFSKISLGYPEMTGSRLIRKEISKLYDNINEHQVLVLGSPIEGIYLTMRALIKENDHVIVLSPAYDALYNVSHHISGNVSRWFLKDDGINWSLDFEQLQSMITSSTKLLVVNFPHNPTGFNPSQDDLNKILEIANHHGVRIFSDEIYRGLEYEPGTRISSIADLSDRAVIMCGASKSFGLPGLRFGWLVIKEPQLYKELLNLKSYTSMCSPQTLEYLGLMAIRGASQLIERNLKIVKENILIAESFFKEWKEHLNWLKPLAGSVSVVKINEPSAEQFCHKMALQFGVVILPIKYMGYQDIYFRIGLGYSNFKANLEIFNKALNSTYR